MKIPTAVADVLRVAAPTLLTAFGGPLGAVAAALSTTALNAWLGPRANDDGSPRSIAEVTQAIQVNKDDPRFLLDLRKAELDLQKYEADLEFRFADLEQKNRQSSRDFQKDTAIAAPLMRWGMGIVVIAIGSLLAIVVGSLLMVAGIVRVPADTAQLAVGVFGLIGAITGYIASYGTQVLGFYYGSSSGEKAQGERTSATLQDMGAALGEAAKSVPARPPAPTPAPVVLMPAPVASSASLAAMTAPVPDAEWKQGAFGGARWRVTPEGVLVEGEAAPERTVGHPVTVRRIWGNYGSMILEACARHGLPAEVVVAVIATESRGIAAATLREPDGRTSSGIMQVLTGTASEVLGRPVTVSELQEPAVSIAAGVGYIAKQRPATGYDPILVAAAYNAGGLYPPREQDTNRFRLRSTGDHLERMRKYYNDAVAVARDDNWFGQPGGAA